MSRGIGGAQTQTTQSQLHSNLDGGGSTIRDQSSIRPHPFPFLPKYIVRCGRQRIYQKLSHRFLCLAVFPCWQQQVSTRDQVCNDEARLELSSSSKVNQAVMSRSRHKAVRDVGYLWEPALKLMSRLQETSTSLVGRPCLRPSKSQKVTSQE
jgi:hypothetical protein